MPNSLKWYARVLRPKNCPETCPRIKFATYASNVTLLCPFVLHRQREGGAIPLAEN